MIGRLTGSEEDEMSTCRVGRGPLARRAAALPGALALVLFLALVQAAGAQGLATFETGPLAIVTADGARHDFNVELAETPAQMSQGLMFRRKLARDAGMLFIYRPPRQAAMWMKNTHIPLDMVFIGTDGRVVKLVERTVPHSLKTVASDGPVAAVLELNGGTVSRLGIAPGDRVLHEALGGS